MQDSTLKNESLLVPDLSKGCLLTINTLYNDLTNSHIIVNHKRNKFLS